MIVELNAKEYAVLRIALADLIKKSTEHKEAVTLTDAKCWDVYSRHENTLNTATVLFNKLT
jgi:hypothetical protein